MQMKCVKFFYYYFTLLLIFYYYLLVFLLLFKIDNIKKIKLCTGGKYN